MYLDVTGAAGGRECKPDNTSSCSHSHARFVIGGARRHGDLNAQLCCSPRLQTIPTHVHQASSGVVHL